MGLNLSEGELSNVSELLNILSSLNRYDTVKNMSRIKKLLGSVPSDFVSKEMLSNLVHCNCIQAIPSKMVDEDLMCMHAKFHGMRCLPKKAQKSEKVLLSACDHSRYASMEVLHSFPQMVASSEALAKRVISEALDGWTIDVALQRLFDNKDVFEWLFGEEELSHLLSVLSAGHALLIDVPCDSDEEDEIRESARRLSHSLEARVSDREELHWATVLRACERSVAAASGAASLVVMKAPDPRFVSVWAGEKVRTELVRIGFSVTDCLGVGHVI